MKKNNDVDMENDELTLAAMQIIIHAGDARQFSDQAFDEAMANNFEEADKLMEKAEEELAKAHQSQTSIIQSNAAGKKYDITLLFIHAQDTLMTIMSEISMIKKMIVIQKNR